MEAAGHCASCCTPKETGLVAVVAIITLGERLIGTLRDFCVDADAARVTKLFDLNFRLR